MHRRCHQNSYSDASIKGAQVFYYRDSEVSKGAAEIMQEELRKVDTENTRQIKSNSDFYMLKKTEVPTIIVECGFLSHPGEAEQLVSEEYQENMAQAICSGIMTWLSGN
ncbi:MAG: N-acetylmuramoyl-L-alanine amidase [Tyzzerella sp.]|nr:N-acetylmuramoyl-L-alanine amidase [Tyzzerella sp.]